MRIWSLHPGHLDAKGLVALWRETLLARHVLEGKTKGYTNHPQLNRFKEQKAPLACINYYLAEIYKEAEARGYSFDRKKFRQPKAKPKMKVTGGQLEYEWKHLKRKLKMRDEKKFKLLNKLKPLPHPIFKVVKGEIADWEII